MMEALRIWRVLVQGAAVLPLHVLGLPESSFFYRPRIGGQMCVDERMLNSKILRGEICML